MVLEQQKQSSFLSSFLKTRELILLILLAIVFMVGNATSDYFLDIYNLFDTTAIFSEISLVALSMALVIIACDIDISVASIIALSSLSMGLAHKVFGVSPLGLVLIGIGVGVLCGMLNGLMAGIAAVFLTARLGSTRPDIALGLELEIITIVVLGGVSILGGKGTITGVFLAALVVGFLRLAITLNNIPGSVIIVFTGTLLILSVSLPLIIKKYLEKVRK